MSRFSTFFPVTFFPLSRQPPDGFVAKTKAYNRSVTKLLEKAFEAASDLPATGQDELAARILDEIAWDGGAKGGGDRARLRRLVDEAREDIRAGRVRELRPEDL
jgi:hypothetical protein